MSGQNKLFDLVRKNRIDRVVELAGQNAYLDSYRYKIQDCPIKDPPIPLDGLSLLHLAAYYDAYECLVFLLENGRSPQTLSSALIPPLHYAAFGSATECTLALCQFGADVNYLPEGSQITPLFLSAFCQTPAICKILLDHGAIYPDAIKDAHIEGRFMPIKAAIRFKQIDIITLLIECQMKRERISRGESSVLMNAISQRMYDCVELLLQNGCDPSYQTPTGRCALSLACFAKQSHVISLLLAYGVKTKVLFENKKTFLHLAAASGDPEIIQMALDTGVDVNVKDQSHKIASFYVSNISQPESIQCFRLLFDAGIDVNALCNGLHVITPMFANKSVLPELISFFLHYGANLDIVSPSGKTIYETGLLISRNEIKEILLAWRKKNPLKK